MRELGWHVIAGEAIQPGQAQPADLPQGGFRFPVPVPFSRENPAECRA